MENRPIAHLTRRYRFSASHRLHNHRFSDDENWRVYGKCNNDFGHGHNYYLEVTVAGPVDPSTGMVADPADLDVMVKREVLDRFDQVNLNEDLECFRELVPTSENLLLEIARGLERQWHGTSSRLVKARLQETGKNFFEYQYL